MSIIHPFEPLYNQDSRILILGSFPSVKSREQLFYYGHPQNRFWRVLAGVYNEPVPKNIPDKKAFILAHQLALWDSIASCEITGSSDASIRNVVANDIAGLLKETAIKEIYCNGAAAYKIYEKYVFPFSNVTATRLPSTSPANAAYSLANLIEEWQIIKNK